MRIRPPPPAVECPRPGAPTIFGQSRLRARSDAFRAVRDAIVSSEASCLGNASCTLAGCLLVRSKTMLDTIEPRDLVEDRAHPARQEGADHEISMARCASGSTGNGDDEDDDLDLVRGTSSKVLLGLIDHNNTQFLV